MALAPQVAGTTNGHSRLHVQHQAAAPIQRPVHRRKSTVAAYSVIDSVHRGTSGTEHPRLTNPLPVSSLVEQAGSSRVSLPQLTFHDLDALEHRPCPCGSLKTYEICCGRLHSGGLPHHAAELARSRFSAHLLGNLQHLEDSMHPDSPDQARPQLLAKACHVFQTLQPRLLDMCHGMVPGSDLTGAETHVVASALLIQRDSSAPAHVFIEVDTYQLHEGRWLFHHKEHQMPTFGSFVIFWDKYGPGHQNGAGVAGDKDSSGRYRFDLVDPRRTPTARRTPSLSRAPTPSLSRSPTPSLSRSPTPSISRTPTPALSRRGTPALSRMPTPAGARRSPTPGPGRSSPTPQPRRTPALTRAPTPGHNRLTPQPTRNSHSHIRPPPSPSRSRNHQPNHDHHSTSASSSADSSTAMVHSSSSAELHQWLLESGAGPDHPLLYMDDVGEGGSSGDNSAGQQAKQLAAQQQMVNMLMDPETNPQADNWLMKQSGFRYES